MKKRISPPAEAAGEAQPALAPDPFTGLGGSYVRESGSDKRVPTAETLIHHKQQRKEVNGQEIA